MQSLFSLWRIGTANISYGDGIGVYEEAVVHPLGDVQTVADVERFPWPDPDEWDYRGLRALCDQWPEYPILAGTSEPFYLYSRLRGMERALTDLIDAPEIADAILERIFEVDQGVFRRILDLRVDVDLDLRDITSTMHFREKNQKERDLLALRDPRRDNFRGAVRQGFANSH